MATQTTQGEGSKRRIRIPSSPIRTSAIMSRSTIRMARGEWKHRTSWHTYEHNHASLTPSHDNDQGEEEQGHGKEAHIHGHSAPEHAHD